MVAQYLAAGLSLLISTGASAASLSDARSAYDRNHIAEAEQIYHVVAADRSASVEDRSAASRELARIAWLIDGDASRTLDRLAQAQKLGGKPCDTGVLTARVLHEAKRSDEALRRGAGLLQTCTEPDKRDAIRTHLIGARLDLAAAQPARRAKLLAEASSQGMLLTPEAGVEGARVRLEAALLTDRPADALAAWKDYFWLDESDAPQALEKEQVAQTFAGGLKAGANVAERLKLADLLMRSGFAQQSRRYATGHGLPGAAASDPVWRRLEAYWRERDTIEATLLRVNRNLAHGKRDDKALETAAKDATAALMKAAGASGDPKAALRKYYGLVGTVGTTSGYPSIHMGYVIEDHSDRVTQYGRSADIHFMSIDNMIGNGFESWLWDGSAMVGGWTADGVIVHVRPGYVSSPMRAFRLTQDSASRKDLIGRQRGRAAEDIAKLKVRPVATLEGLSDRLQLQLVDQIWAGARSKTSNEADARRTFLAEYSRANLNQSIRVHEGRHAIDETLHLKVEQPELEYRAKLSELALTAYPRMALANLDRSLEGDGPHDKAGARIFDAYRRWIDAHADQVMGYDPAVPSLEQLDKLTDGQLREIARGLDPLAQSETPKSN
jgi:ribosomal protein S12